jgi:hypothetical protein
VLVTATRRKATTLSDKAKPSNVWEVAREATEQQIEEFNYVRVLIAGFGDEIIDESAVELTRKYWLDVMNCAPADLDDDNVYATYDVFKVTLAEGWLK